MAHELGHIAGLRHEHQRPDAKDHIIVDYIHLPDGLNVYQAIQSKDRSHGYEDGDTITEAMNDPLVAKRYRKYYPGFPADQLMPLDEADHRGPQPMSPKIDFDSVRSLEQRRHILSTNTYHRS